MQISISNAVGGGGGNLGSGGGGVPFTNTKSFTFDGNTDFITMGNTINMAQDGSDAFSFSFWMKRTSGSGVQTFLGKVHNNGKGVTIYSNGTTIYMLIGTYSSACIFNQFNFTTLNNGSWHHIVWTYDGSSTQAGMKLYINDDLKTLASGITNTPINLQNTAVDFILGSRPSNLRYNGLMDEVSYFNTVLSSTDVTNIFNLGVPNNISGVGGLVSWWRMGDLATHDGAKWLVPDQGSGGNDGTSTTIPAPPTQPSTDVPT